MIGETAGGQTAGNGMEELARRFRVDFLTYLPARVIPAGMGLATVALFTRLFTPEQYGQYALVLAAGGIAVVLLGGWLRECAIRFLPEEQGLGREDAFIVGLLGQALATALLPVAALAAAYLLGLVPTAYASVAPWATLWVSAAILYGTLLALLQAGLQARRFTLWEAVRSVSGLAVAVAYLMLVDRSVAGAFVGLSLSCLAVGALIVRELRVSAKVSRLKVGGAGMRHPLLLRFAAYGLPLVGWAAGREILNLGDRFVIEWFLGSEPLGIYASNYYLADGGAALLFIPLLAAVRPLAMHTWANEGAEQTQGLVRLGTRTMLLLLLPCLSALAVLAPALAGVLVAPGYREGALVMPLVLAGDGLWSLGQLGHQGLMLARRTTVMLGGVLLCAAVNIGLNVLSVPRWGYMAAAVTTVISYGLYPLFAFWTSRGILRWRFPWRSLARGSVGALGSGAVLWLGWGTDGGQWVVRALCTALAPVIYVLTLMALGEVSRSELVEVARTLRGPKRDKG